MRMSRQAADLENADEEEEDEDDERPSRPKRRGKLTEFEMALLWNQFKDNQFPGGRVNQRQLTQMLRQVRQYLLSLEN